MASHAAPQPKTRWFAVGGPLFNLAMVVLLMGISTFVVMSPSEASPRLDERASGPDGQTAEWPGLLAFADGNSPAAAVVGSASPTPDSAEGTGEPGSSIPNGTGEGDDVSEGSARNPTSPYSYPYPYSPPWVSGTVRYDPSPVAPTTPTPVPTATPEPTPTPRPTPTPEPTPTPRPTPRPTPVPLPQCDDFSDRANAQAVYDTDPTRLAHMDGDRDGVACEHLPAPPPPPVPSRAQVVAETGIYGIHTRDAPWWMGEVDHIARLTGSTPGTVLFFANFAQGYPAGPIDTIWRRGMIPVVAWEPIVPGGSHPRLAEIIDGDHDAYIDDWATAARNDGRPIVIRLAAEMNGNWYPWSETQNGNSSGEFAEAWRHIHDRFDAMGADNVIWLWSVNRTNNLSTDIADFYPGDDYVDWVGMSGYLRQIIPGVTPGFNTTFGVTLGQLRALTSKPILLAEVGAGTDEATKASWIRSLFEGLEASPDIIGFLYFNDQKSGGDWRLQATQSIVDAFADGVENPRWRTGIDPGGMVPGERITLPAPGAP